MTTVGEIYEYLDRIAPFALAESWDNSGLLCGSSELPADSVLVSLDITSEVAAEAAEIGAQLIVSHHPASAPSAPTPILISPRTASTTVLPSGCALTTASRFRSRGTVPRIR